MRNFSMSMALIFMCMISCQTEDAIVPPKPIAEIDVRFSWGGPLNTESSLVMGTHDITLLSSTSANADSIVWDFGNGMKSRAENVTVIYSEKGDYNLTLTAFGKQGTKSVATKKISVKERILTNISIDNLDINSFARDQSGLPVFSKFDIWIELKFSQTMPAWTSNNDFTAPTIYKSPVFSQVDSSYHSSLRYAIPRSESAVINYPVNNNDFIQGPGLFANLYAKDNNGIYLLYSSGWSGAGFFIVNGANPANSDYFGLVGSVPGSGTRVSFDCRFE